MSKIKKIKGFTILELVISITILSVCLPSVFKITSFIAKNKSFNKTTYLAVLECRNLLEGTKKLVNNYGTDFIISEKNKGTTIKELLLTSGYKINSKDFYFGISINEIGENNSNIKLTDNNNIDFDNNITFKTNDIFILNDSENNNYNLIIEETDDGFILLENNSSASVEILPMEINILIENMSVTDNLIIKINSKNIDDKKINICNMTENNIYLDLVSNSQHNLKLENINYTGNKNLLLNTKEVNIKKINYILTVSVYNKEFKLLKRLGTLI